MKVQDFRSSVSTLRPPVLPHLFLGGSKTPG